MTSNQIMSIQKELDSVRKQKFRKDMQAVYDKLNEVCLELADMRLEDFAEIMEEQNLHLDDDDHSLWQHDEEIPHEGYWHYNPDFRGPDE